jgi:polysaccharide export outer membrane protein
MYKKITQSWFISLLFLLSMSSCKTNDELIYLKNLQQNDVMMSQPFSTDSYHLRPGDNLFIQVTSPNTEVNQLFNPAIQGNNSGTSQQFGSPSSQYLNGYLIDQDGFIELPVFGQLTVAGKTVREVKNLVVSKVDEYFKEASVIVRLLNFKVTIIGEVNQPGILYPYNNTYTLLEAISQAGGTTDYSSLKKAVIIRETPAGIINMEVDLTDKSFLTSNAYYLQPNDVVYVSPDKNKNLKINAAMYSLAFSTISLILVIAKLF